MTIGRASAMAAGYIAAFAVGVAIGPAITHRGQDAPPRSSAVDMGQSSVQPGGRPGADIVLPAPPRPKVARAATPGTATPKPGKAGPPAPIVVAASAPALAVRLKPVLNRGANMQVAAEGFRDAEQFAAVAHAARNTKVPFMVLKHHILDENQSLADAIRAAKPALDATAEATRARTEARSDVAAVASLAAN